MEDLLVPLAVACPSCGRWDVVMVKTGAVLDRPGTWVVPLDRAAPPLHAS